jgi:hypothetical protein
MEELIKAPGLDGWHGQALLLTPYFILSKYLSNQVPFSTISDCLPTFTSSQRGSSVQKGAFQATRTMGHTSLHVTTIPPEGWNPRRSQHTIYSFLQIH